MLLSSVQSQSSSNASAKQELKRAISASGSTTPISTPAACASASRPSARETVPGVLSMDTNSTLAGRPSPKSVSYTPYRGDPPNDIGRSGTRDRILWNHPPAPSSTPPSSPATDAPIAAAAAATPSPPSSSAAPTSTKHGRRQLPRYSCGIGGARRRRHSTENSRCARGRSSPPPPPPTDPDPAAPPVALVRHWLHASASAASPPPAALDGFSDGYRSLDLVGRREVLRSLAIDYDVPRARVRDLMRQYMSVASAEPSGGDDVEAEGKEGAASALYRMERGLRDALRPRYAGFLEAMNAQPGGLKLLAVLRADLLALLGEENAPALRALDSYLKEKLVTWLSPAALTLHQITWDDPASLLEKIVAYEAVHPIRNLIDLKRRLGIGRRCFGYFHPAIPGEPLIFIEVALLKDMAASIQEVLWDDPPAPESEASRALFYSISSTQPGLSGINLGKFLLKRVIDMLRRDMPSVQIFATLSPIPGFMQWLLAKLASQIKLSEAESQEGNSLGACSTFKESILLPDEERMIHDAIEKADGKQGIELLQDILKSRQWVKSGKLSSALKPPLMRLCARYLAREKKRGKALDAVANFHLQNGAMIERINWMADQSEKGIQQSGGIMVNYLYRLENIEEYALSYSSTGLIHSSPSLSEYLELKDL